VSSSLDRWSNSRRSLLIGLGAVLLVAVVVLVAVLVSRGGAGTPTATATTVGTDRTPPPTPEPVVTVEPEPETTATVRVPPLSDADEITITGTEAAEVDGVSVRLTSLRPVATRSSGPGEVSGPGLAVTIAVTNGTSAALENLNDTQVSLFWGPDGTPGVYMSTDPHIWAFPSTLAPGATGESTWVFTTGQNSAGTDVALQVLLGELPVIVVQATVGS